MNPMTVSNTRPTASMTNETGNIIISILFLLADGALLGVALVSMTTVEVEDTLLLIDTVLLLIDTVLLLIDTMLLLIEVIAGWVSVEGSDGVGVCVD